MMKRIRWFLLGVIVGFATFVYLRERIRDLKDRYAAVRGTATALSAIGGLRRDLRDAWADGRTKMRSTEQRLRTRRTERSSRS